MKWSQGLDSHRVDGLLKVEEVVVQRELSVELACRVNLHVRMRE
jgi:hypothetical protein